MRKFNGAHNNDVIRSGGGGLVVVMRLAGEGCGTTNLHNK